MLSIVLINVVGSVCVRDTLVPSCWFADVTFREWSVGRVALSVLRDENFTSLVFRPITVHCERRAHVCMSLSGYACVRVLRVHVGVQARTKSFPYCVKTLATCAHIRNGRRRPRHRVHHPRTWVKCQIDLAGLSENSSYSLLMTSSNQSTLRNNPGNLVDKSGIFVDEPAAEFSISRPVVPHDADNRTLSRAFPHKERSAVSRLQTTRARTQALVPVSIAQTGASSLLPTRPAT